MLPLASVFYHSNGNEIETPLLIGYIVSDYNLLPFSLEFIPTLKS